MTQDTLITFSRSCHFLTNDCSLSSAEACASAALVERGQLPACLRFRWLSKSMTVYVSSDDPVTVRTLTVTGSSHTKFSFAVYSSTGSPRKSLKAD